MTVVKFGYSTPKRTVSPSAAETTAGIATAAEADARKVLRLTRTAIVSSNCPGDRFWGAYISNLPVLVPAESMHDIREVRAQTCGGCRIALARTRQIDRDVLADAARRR